MSRRVRAAVVEASLLVQAERFRTMVGDPMSRDAAGAHVYLLSARAG